MSAKTGNRLTEKALGCDSTHPNEGRLIGQAGGGVAGVADPGPILSAFGWGRRPRPPAAMAGVKRTTPVEYRPHPISTAGVELSPEILEYKGIRA
jgi:hypothetical protein